MGGLPSAESVSVLAVHAPTWVGDALMATPTFRAIAKKFPNAQRILVTRPHIAELLDGTPWFSETLTFQGNDDRAVVQQLTERSVDLGVLLPNSFRSAWRFFRARVRHRVGYAGDWRGLLLHTALPRPRAGGRGKKTVGDVSRVELPVGDALVTFSKTGQPSAREYYLAIAAATGADVAEHRLEVAVTRADEEAAQSWANATGLDLRRPYVVVNPGASFGPSKCWPADRFGAVIGELHRHRGLQVAVVSGPGEEAVVRRVVESAGVPVAHCLENPLSLGPLKRVVREAQLMLTNDTGPRHIAVAWRVPVVVPIGSTDPICGEHPDELGEVLRLSLDCSPCHEPICPLDHHRCMRDISIEMIIGACQRVLEAHPKEAVSKDEA